MIHLAVCDDNPDELSNMIRLIDQYKSSRHIHCRFTAFRNGFELISALEKGSGFHIYCLDIIMPSYTGIAVAKEIRDFDKSAPILFFTSSKEFAFESYSVNAINYVLKPVTEEKLFFTLDQVLERIKTDEYEDFIIVRSHEGIQKILVSNLVFAETIGRSVLYHMLSGKVVECTESFNTACHSLLKYGCFLKTHRSFIVNMQYVDIIENHQLTLQTLSKIPIAQGKGREIKQRYLAYQMEGQ